MDSFEWQEGYKTRRGLFYVDFNNKDKALTPKSSALYYKQVISQNGFPSATLDSPIKGQFPCDYSWGITDSILKVCFAALYPCVFHDMSNKHYPLPGAD